MASKAAVNPSSVTCSSKHDDVKLCACTAISGDLPGGTNALDWGNFTLAGTMTVDANGSKATEPSSCGTFLVHSGPCTVSDGGRCVGRPHGYGPNERCQILVSGAGGILGACGVFDTSSGTDKVTLAGLSPHDMSDCPVGAVLTPGQVVGWESSATDQGSVGDNDNGCAAKGSCGLQYSQSGIGGGWQICFA